MGTAQFAALENVSGGGGMNYQHSLLRDRLAAEYVLGTLHGAARRRFEQLLPAHPTLRQAVSRWECQLNRLAAATAPIPPPPAVWKALEQRLFAPPINRSWWNSLSFWRGLAAAGLLATLVAIVPPLLSPILEANLNFAAIYGKQRQVLWTVALASDGRLHVNNLQAMPIPPDQRCFLWLKSADAPPVMLGMLPDDGSTRTLMMPMESAQRLRSALWVTMQPLTPKPQVPTEPLYQAHWKAI